MKKLIFLLLFISFISCSGGFGPGELGEISFCTIKMYLSDNCEGNTVIGTIFTGQDFRKLEQSMAERELGECVELSVNGKSYIKTFGNSDLQNAYISIEAQKSWIVSKDCCGTFCVD